MTATERLRALLDERGVEWRVGDYPTTCTVWESDGIVWYGLWRDGCIELIAWQVTPEQAVEATLGPGTCKPVISDNLNASEGAGDAWADCSACGHLLFVLTDPNSQPPNYCPNCGRKLVE